MKFMLLVKADADSEAGVLPDTEWLSAMGAYNEALARAGVLLGGEGLYPSAQGARVHFDGRARRVEDGPFADTAGLVAGFWLIQARSLEEAIEWVKRVPNREGARSQIEIRRVADSAELAPALAPERRAAPARLSERAAGH